MRDLRTPRLRRMLAELRSVQPDSSWVQSTREALLQKIGGKEIAPVSFGERVGLMIRSLMPLPARAALRGPIAAALSGLGLIVGGSMAGVSAAEQSVPGDLLFPVKLVSEQTRLVFASDKTDKVRLKGEFVNRRVEEIKKIAQADDIGKKPQRLKEATEMLRRDLDTVKNQLTDSSGDSPSERVEVAKLIDKASTEAVVGLKVAKASLPLEERPQFAEAEAAAVNTSVKAVNAILDSQTQDEAAKKLVSKEELLESINQKVEGVSDHITSATEQLTNAGILSASGTLAFVSTTPTLNSSTSSFADLASASASLAEARQLLSQDRLSEVGDKLIEASKSASSAERSAESVVAASSSTSDTRSASTTNAVPPGMSTSSVMTSAASPPASTTSATPSLTTSEKQ